MRKALFFCLILLAGCEPRPYTYPSPAEAPLAPSAVHAPRTIFVPPQRVASLPPVGPLTARNVGAYMDGEERELRTDLRASGVGISRPGDEIALYLRDDLLFAEGTVELAARARPILTTIGAVLQRYDGTMITVDSYTDTAGAPDRNIQLSQERADAVAQALAAMGVTPRRIAMHGLGPTHLKIPTGPNTVEPRNRRIEIVLSPRKVG